MTLAEAAAFPQETGEAEDPNLSAFAPDDAESQAAEGAADVPEADPQDQPDTDKGVTIPGEVHEAVVLLRAIQRASYPESDEVARHAEQVARGVLQQRIALSMPGEPAIEAPLAVIDSSTEHFRALDVPLAAKETTSVDDDEVDDAVPMSPEDMFGDDKDDDTVAMSPEDMFGDDDDEPEVAIDTDTLLSEAREAVYDGRDVRERLEERDVLIKENAAVQGTEPTFTEEEFGVAVEALEKHLLVAPDEATRTEDAEVLHSLGVDTEFLERTLKSASDAEQEDHTLHESAAESLRHRVIERAMGTVIRLVPFRH